MLDHGEIWLPASDLIQGEPRPTPDGAAILSSVVPVVLDLMLDVPNGGWGTPMYPVVGG